VCTWKASAAGYNQSWRQAGQTGAYTSSFDNRRQLRKSPAAQGDRKMSKMEKIAGLREILELEPTNSFARYGLAMELAGRGETDAALSEFDTLLAHDPGYTAGYFMAAQTLAAAGRTAAASERLKSGVESARRSGNQHAVSEMQAMLDELDR
jgi:predicted Zn-dependent protease